MTMYSTIKRLLDESPRLSDLSGFPDMGQTPAMVCTVVLHGINGADGKPQAFSGALSLTPEGGVVRMMTPLKGEPKFLEQFFHADAIALVMLERAISTNASRIIS